MFFECDVCHGAGEIPDDQEPLSACCHAPIIQALRCKATSTCPEEWDGKCEKCGQWCPDEWEEEA